MWQHGAPIRRAYETRAAEVWNCKLESFRLSSVYETPCNRGVAIDTAVAEEWPVAAGVLDDLEIHLAEQDLLFVVRGFGNDAPEWIAQERASPKFKSLTGDPV